MSNYAHIENGFIPAQRFVTSVDKISFLSKALLSSKGCLQPRVKIIWTFKKKITRESNRQKKPAKPHLVGMADTLPFDNSDEHKVTAHGICRLSVG